MLQYLSKLLGGNKLSRQYKTSTYIVNITVTGEKSDVPAVYTRAGTHILEAAVLDVLPAPTEAYMDINAIKEQLELPIKTDNNYNWGGFLIEGILSKLQTELRVQPEVSVTEKGIRRIGWRLSQNEYQRRLNNGEGNTDE